MTRPGLRIVFALVFCLAVARGPDPWAAGAAAPARRTPAEAFCTFAADGRYLLTFPARTNAKGVWLTAGVAAATALAMNRDEEIRTDVVEADRPAAGRIATKFEPLGRIEVEAAALGSLYLAGRAAKNERIIGTAATAFESYLWAAIITSAAKGAFGRERPGRGSGEGEFFAGDSIFPSGHTARSFAIAAVFADRYGRKAAWLAYPVAALVGLSTIQQDNHWLSDIVAGAGLGLAIGKGIAARHAAARGGDAPPKPPGGRGATWRISPQPGGAELRISY